MVQIDYTTLGPAQLRRSLDGGRGHHGPVLARSAPGLLFLSPTNPAWPTRVAGPPGWPRPGRRRRGLCAWREGGKGGRTETAVWWCAPRRVSSSFPPRIQPGPPAWPTPWPWPTRLADPLADAGVAFVHGAKEAMEGGPLTVA